MTTLSNEPSRLAPGARPWSARILVPEMWASLAIVTMWLAVLFDAVFGPDMVFTNDTPGSGTNSTIPSAVPLALFAFLGTWVVAKHAYGRRDDRD